MIYRNSTSKRHSFSLNINEESFNIQAEYNNGMQWVETTILIKHNEESSYIHKILIPQAKLHAISNSFQYKTSSGKIVLIDTSAQLSLKIRSITGKEYLINIQIYIDNKMINSPFILLGKDFLEKAFPYEIQKDNLTISLDERLIVIQRHR